MQMATSKSLTPKNRKSAAATASRPAPTRRRASQRARGVELELGYPGKLRPLMIEQSRTEEGGYITVYAGVCGEFLAAGVPPQFIPTEGSAEFEIRRNHKADTLRATMNAIDGDRLELEIDWGFEMPYMYGHPAICEIARMMSIDFGYWSKSSDRSYDAGSDFEQPIKELIAHDRATDFKGYQDVNPVRLQVSLDFHSRLSQMASHLYEEVHRYGEVFPVPNQATVEPERKLSRMRLVTMCAHERRHAAEWMEGQSESMPVL
jgi:hypothetical protein